MKLSAGRRSAVKGLQAAARRRLCAVSPAAQREDSEREDSEREDSEREGSERRGREPCGAAVPASGPGPGCRHPLSPLAASASPGGGGCRRAAASVRGLRYTPHVQARSTPIYTPCARSTPIYTPCARSMYPKVMQASRPPRSYPSHRCAFTYCPSHRLRGGGRSAPCRCGGAGGLAGGRAARRATISLSPTCAVPWYGGPSCGGRIRTLGGFAEARSGPQRCRQAVAAARTASSPAGSRRSLGCVTRSSNRLRCLSCMWDKWTRAAAMPLCGPRRRRDGAGGTPLRPGRAGGHRVVYIYDAHRIDVTRVALYIYDADTARA